MNKVRYNDLVEFMEMNNVMKKDYKEMAREIIISRFTESSNILDLDKFDSFRSYFSNIHPVNYSYIDKNEKLESLIKKYVNFDDNEEFTGRADWSKVKEVDAINDKYPITSEEVIGIGNRLSANVRFYPSNDIFTLTITFKNKKWKEKLDIEKSQKILEDYYNGKVKEASIKIKKASEEISKLIGLKKPMYHQVRS